LSVTRASDAETRAEVQLVELARRSRIPVAPEVVQLSRLQIEYGCLIVRLGGGKIQRVSEPGVDGDPVRQAPVILNEVLLEVRAVADRVLLEVDGELLHLAKQKARQRCARVGDAGEIGEQAAEGEQPSR
jgi:hypothetical protein